MKFKRSTVDESNMNDLIKQVIGIQCTLRGIIETNEYSSVDRYTDVTKKIQENTLLLETVLLQMGDLKSEIDEINKPWYKKIVCL